MQLDRKQLPGIALRGMTIFPGMIIHFDISRKKSITAVEEAMMGDQQLFLVTQRDVNDMDPDINGVYEIGTIATIKQVTKLPNNMIRILVEGTMRASLNGFVEESVYLLADVNEIKPYIEGDEDISAERKAMALEMKSLFKKYATYFPKIGQSVWQGIEHQKNLEIVMDQIMINMPVGYEEKQGVLGAISIIERYEYLSKLLFEEIEIAKIRNDLSTQVKERVEKNQREYVLKEQLQYIRKELGEDVDAVSEKEQFEQDLKKLKASKEIKSKIQKEINRFVNIPPNSAESTVERNYIETLLGLPWDKSTKNSMDFTKAEEILEEDHYGLEEVKERILEFLAVRALTKKGQSPIVCLVGPPGTGKTSIARSVARALQKKYVRVSLGGVRDEAEIRGHRKTYIGAMPGRIVDGLKQAGVKNPVMLFDEIDKMSSSHNGDTASAMLEVLDSEQNVQFRDHYVELPIDLSEVLFLATANVVTDIPKPLLDRMELIQVSSYTANEKFYIAREHLVEKQIAKHGLADKLSIDDAAIRHTILEYTREAGVRELERKMGQICRKVAKEILQKGESFIQVKEDNLERYLGKPIFNRDKISLDDEVGVVRGLAYTSVGGEVLRIEVNKMPGKGQLELTGKLGDVMKESAKTAISYVRSVGEKYGVDPAMFQDNDFHIHVPDGAVPKDGPSAGLAMAIAFLSAVTNIPVKGNLAMTGEVTLRGKALPIGGLKEKMLGAKMEGITMILVPKSNHNLVEEISEEIKEGMTIHFVENMDDVVAHALV